VITVFAISHRGDHRVIVGAGVRLAARQHTTSASASRTTAGRSTSSTALFFASTADFLSTFIAEDPDEVVIDFACQVMDHWRSAIDSPPSYCGRQAPTCATQLRLPELLTKAKDMVEIDVRSDPHYHIADNVG
jgi:hypothetical protein